MALECEACGEKHDPTLLETTAECPSCGTRGEALNHVSESRVTTAGSSPPYTVLLAEDDSTVRQVYRSWLAADSRWMVREATNGAEALATLDSEVDVLVVDRELPKVSGPELVDRLAETIYDGPVLVVSGHEQDDSLNETDVAGYLTKPFDQETFVALLKQHLP